MSTDYCLWMDLMESELKVLAQNGKLIARILNDGIFELECVQPGAILDLDDAKWGYDQLKSNFQGKKFPVLVNVRQLDGATRANREFASQHYKEFILCGALLIESQLSAVIANFFIKVSRPPYPSRIFLEKEEAIRWLKSQNIL